MANKLVPWTPFDFDTAFDYIPRSFTELFAGENGGRMPAIDVERGKNDVIVRADLPGVKPDQVKIEVQDGMLTISGQREEEKEKKEKSYVRHERRYGSFMRSIALPQRVDPSKITAKTSDGVVEITIPLPKESKKESVTITPTSD